MRRRAPRAGPSGSQEEPLKLALRFLGYRARSEAEVRAKLERQGFAAEAIARSLNKLRSLNYLNDESFARGWARDRAENRGYGPRRIERELREKGIVPPLIRAVLHETFPRGEEEERAKRLMEKKFKREALNDPKVLRRAIAFLRRRGYAAAVILDLLRQPPENDLIEEE